MDKNGKNSALYFHFKKGSKDNILNYLEKRAIFIITIILLTISIISFITFYLNGLGLAYNDARSHLDIGRRVVEGLKPGLAQLGSVWLPLTHTLMIPTIWNDFMWHSGLSGAVPSMVSYILVGILIYLFLKQLYVGLLGRFLAVFIFASNLNILYLQSTAMTELLLLATMTAGTYELLRWYKNGNVLHLIKSAFFIMLATLIRYDGWFLLFSALVLLAIEVFRRYGKKYQLLEGKIIIFFTLGGFGIFLWLLWNLLIFKDPLYFIFGPYSAYAQQKVLEGAGNLSTKGNLLLSIKFYLYALAYNSNTFIALLGFLGTIVFLLDKRIRINIKIALTALFAPLAFNVIALYFGHSVLYIQGLSGDTWFNARYGVMMVPTFSIFAGFLIDRLKQLRPLILGLVIFITFFTFLSGDAVTIDDAREGASQKNVKEISMWLNQNAKNKEGFILISAASHDAIIFSSGLPMKKFIHEGTGDYWKSASDNPDSFARWIIMRTYDEADSTYKNIGKNPALSRYDLVGKYPFADIYQLKEEYLENLNTKEVFPNQK